MALLQAGRMRLQSGGVYEFNNAPQLCKMHVGSERYMAVPLTWESERETGFTEAESPNLGWTMSRGITCDNGV
jgi:hypothetical protein